MLSSAQQHNIESKFEIAFRSHYRYATVVEINPAVQPDPTPVSAQGTGVMFTEAKAVAQQRIRSCAESREIQYCSWLSGTAGGQMEVYAILSWLSVNVSLSYLLRGQLR